MKKLIVPLLLIIAAAVAWKLISSKAAPLASVTYSCDQDRTIDATYYSGEARATAPGEMPQPGGSVVVSIDGAPAVTLKQTVSADGARYANADESLVFWNKGDQALIMRNNAMDLTYTNCTAPAKQ